jgi:hypothetical protein
VEIEVNIVVADQMLTTVSYLAESVTCWGKVLKTTYFHSNDFSNLIGEAAHRFLGVNPQTGKIIGAVAGNVIFQLGGKDNKLSNIGKIILGNKLNF